MSEAETESRITPIGMVAISAKDGSIVSLTIGTDRGHSDSAILDRAFVQLDEYLSGKRKMFDLPVSPKGTDFQMDVWKNLVKIPYGRTISYSELARISGHEGASRATGNAVGRNPVPVIIPCHRVIRSDGSTGGFSLDIAIKERLLRLEGSL